MADGSSLTRSAQDSPLSLDEAIRRLESGHGEVPEIDLGQGRIARIQGPRGRDGLLQRLRAHRILTALASGETDMQRLPADRGPLQIAPEVRDILRAVAARARPASE